VPNKLSHPRNSAKDNHSPSSPPIPRIFARIGSSHRRSLSLPHRIPSSWQGTRSGRNHRSNGAAPERPLARNKSPTVRWNTLRHPVCTRKAPLRTRLGSAQNTPRNPGKDRRRSERTHPGMVRPLPRCPSSRRSHRTLPLPPRLSRCGTSVGDKNAKFSPRENHTVMSRPSTRRSVTHTGGHWYARSRANT
jgi:hypothetical protein